MDIPTDPHARRRLIALLGSGVVFVILAGIGAYGLLAGSTPAQMPSPAKPPSSTSPLEPRQSPSESADRPEVEEIPRTRDAEEFARSVAAALFTWETGSGILPFDYAEALIDVGDPSGEEQAGLAADIAGYFPTQSAWFELREYATTQQLEIDQVFIPDAWAEAVAQAQPGQLPPGAAAYTVIGTREREGVWNGEPVHVSEAVEFTVFVACPASKDPCYLLRLSQLNNPLR